MKLFGQALSAVVFFVLPLLVSATVPVLQGCGGGGDCCKICSVGNPSRIRRQVLREASASATWLRTILDVLARSLQTENTSPKIGMSNSSRFSMVVVSAVLLISSATAQSPPKKTTPVPTSHPAYTAQNNSAAIATLRTEIESVKQRITDSESEDQKYTGGLIKSQIQLRIAVLKTTEALLLQKVSILSTGAKQVFEANVHKPDAVVAAAIEADIAALKSRIESARIEADKYTGGLIKVTRESTIATMEGTLANLEQRGLTAKYGLPTTPAAIAASNQQMATKPAAKATAKAKTQDEIVMATLVSKRLSEQKYEKMIVLDIEFVAANLKKPSRAIKGTLNINDLFGEKQMGIGWTIDRPLNLGERMVESGQGFKFNQFMDRHNWVKNTERENMAVTFTVESILYEDGSREDF